MSEAAGGRPREAVPATVGIVLPPGGGVRTGNRVTALRWAAVARGLGLGTFVAERWDGRPCEILVALHAARSHDAVAAFRREHPQVPLVVALTGTDVYGSGPEDPLVRGSLEIADRIVCLQDRMRAALPPALRAKARVVHQSAPAEPAGSPPPAPPLRVCALGHLRAVKDPFLLPRALESLPDGVPVSARHAGAALDERHRDAAEEWSRRVPRWRWLGPLPRRAARALLVSCHALVVTSRLEGACNSVSEALAAGVPVLSTRTDGAVGMLGEDHPGLVPVADVGALATLLQRAVDDGGFRRELAEAGRRRAALVDPAREREAWAALLSELGVGG